MIEIDNLSYWYPGVPAPAINEVNLSVPEGQFVLILGPSGCGKSTLLMALNGVVPHLTGGKIKGRVYIDGQDTLRLRVPDLASITSLILQDPESQLTNLYVYDEVAFGPENLCLPEVEVRERVEQALELVGLEDLRNRSVFALSGGQKQRVAIAAAMAMRPRILLLDNPTSNLDPVGAAETYAAIRALHASQKNLTILLAEHRPDLVTDVADRLIIMHEGKVIRDGSPRDLLDTDGDYLREDLGLFLPEATELALELRQRDMAFPTLPLSVSEAVLTLPEGLTQQAISQDLTTPQVRSAPASAEVAVEARDLAFAYPGGVRAVDGVSLRINAGEFVCLIGQNGSGKTTLAKLLVGLLNPLSGEVHLLGHPMSRTPLREVVGDVGYVFQYPEHQFVANTVFDEVAFGLRVKKLPEETVEARVNETLATFALIEVANNPPLTLSKGQKRRLSVATMLVTNPLVLILDEPMTGQDRRNIRNLLAILNGMRGQGTTIIDITHDMGHVATYADRVVAMNNGQIVFDGTPEALFQRGELLAELSLEAPPVWAIAQAWREHGIPVPASATTVERFMQCLSVSSQGE